MSVRGVNGVGASPYQTYSECIIIHSGMGQTYLRLKIDA